VGEVIDLEEGAGVFRKKMGFRTGCCYAIDWEEDEVAEEDETEGSVRDCPVIVEAREALRITWRSVVVAVVPSLVGQREHPLVVLVAGEQRLIIAVFRSIDRAFLGYLGAPRDCWGEGEVGRGFQ
jgi:hypothetical protein